MTHITDQSGHSDNSASTNSSSIELSPTLQQAITPKKKSLDFHYSSFADIFHLPPPPEPQETVTPEYKIKPPPPIHIHTNTKEGLKHSTTKPTDHSSDNRSPDNEPPPPPFPPSHPHPQQTTRHKIK